MFKIELPNAGVMDAKRAVGNHVLTLRARNMRLSRDGYARCLLGMIVDTTAVYSDIVDIEDADARHKVAMALYGTQRETRDGTMSRTGRSSIFGTEITTQFSQSEFEQELMVWARAAWNGYIGPSAGKDIAGDAEPSVPPWVIPGLVMAGATSIWVGPAAAGKSTLQRLAAQSIRYGLTHVFPVQSQGVPIWVNAEEPPAEHTRQLGNVNQALGLPRTSPMFTLHVAGMRIEDVASRLEKSVREIGATDIFVDSLSRLAQGQNLNENATATLLVDSLAALGCSVNWIGHTGWENPNRIAGSRHFENAARVMVLVQSRISLGGVSPELTRGVRTRVTKANGALDTEGQYWTLDYHRQHGLLEARRSSHDDWPTLRCGFVSGEGTECHRRTWDGVGADGKIRCARHRDDGDET